MKTIIQKFKDQKIAVLGDFVADVYITGITKRISREAPVLIIEQEDERIIPGAAGNVVMNIKSMGGDPIPIGYLGYDKMGNRISEFFRSHQISTQYLMQMVLINTSTKTRILAGREDSVKQQILRLDSNGKKALDQEFQSILIKSIKEVLENVNALIISDYGEEVVNDLVFKYLLEHVVGTIPTYVDSRYNIKHFKNATALFPNEYEVIEAYPSLFIKGDEIDAGRMLLDKTNSECVLLKRGKNGMALFEKNIEAKYVNAYGLTAIADSIGCGDTVIGAFALANQSGASFLDSTKIANVAGGIQASKNGTAVVAQDELMNSMEKK